MPLEVRIYNCKSCGETIDRDYNASINILNFSKLIPDGTSGINGHGDDLKESSLKCQKEPKLVL